MTFKVRARKLAREIAVGDSVAVNGVCQTVTHVDQRSFRFDSVVETLKTTNLSVLSQGSAINLEPALCLGDRVSGHLVSGHVDCVGTMAAKRPSPGQVTIEARVTPEVVAQLIPKGSVNLLVACRGASFSHIAASSCRLSRTIVQLGRAAGTAAATAAREDVPVAQIDAGALQEQLGLGRLASESFPR